MTVTRGRLGLVVALLAVLATVIAAGLTSKAAPPGAGAASHREAPLISLDAPADITDFYLFRSYEPGKSQNVVLIMDTFPGGEPSSGPNYFQFDPSVTYSFEIDNNRDGVADDVRFDVRFSTEIRGLPKDLGLPLSFVGGLGPIPRIDSLDHPGVGLKQTYTVTMTKKGFAPTVIATGTTAPPRVGPRTTGTDAQYDAIAAQAAVTISGGGRVWAGPRDDPFAIDLGAIFDSLNFRAVGSAGGLDMLSGFNVQTIALEVPASWVSNGSNILGAYASTSRNKVRVLDTPNASGTGPLVQVQRLANPLVNEVIIGVADKDLWNATSPDKESLFEGYYLKPRVSLALQLASGLDTSCLPLGVPGCAPASPAPAADLGLSNFNRTDLVALLLQYNGVLYGSGPGGAKSDLLRLNFGIPPKPLADQNRLGVLGGDLAGWPNGRRPNDDVTDIAVQAAGGQKYLAGTGQPVPAGVGDGVSVNDKPLSTGFPFLAAPHDGRQRMHSNP
jgi:hypothetical protein